MMNIKRQIVESFKNEYGFAPAMNAIKPLESIGTGNNTEWLAFHINGIGYEYRIGGKVERNENYNL